MNSRRRSSLGSLCGEMSLAPLAVLAAARVASHIIKRRGFQDALALRGPLAALIRAGKQEMSMTLKVLLPAVVAGMMLASLSAVDRPAQAASATAAMAQCGGNRQATVNCCEAVVRKVKSHKPAWMGPYFSCTKAVTCGGHVIGAKSKSSHCVVDLVQKHDFDPSHETQGMRATMI